jgi:hypothetical protein
VLILAHAFGKRYDLPVPLYLFVLGGAAVVFVSFLVVLPTQVALTGGGTTLADRSGRNRPRISGGAVVLVGLAGLILAGLIGSQEVPENIVPTAFWLIVWIAVPISCGLLGDWTRPVNPFITLAYVVDRASVRRVLLGGAKLDWPSWLGWWPATFLFFAISCGELIFNSTATLPQATAIGLLCYALLTMFAALMFGADEWIARGEMFAVLFATWGRLGWFRFGTPGRKGILGGLDGATFEPSVSRVTFVLLLLVSVSFDGLLATPAWRHARTQLNGGFAQGTIGYQLGELVAYIVLVAVVWALFAGFAWGVQRAGRLKGSPVSGLAGLLPSVLPIAFGYLVAHNLEYLVINGQLLLPLLGNPLGWASWPTLHYPFNDSYEININLVPSSVVWYFQVALIVAVHVAAVVLAHRYLGRTARKERAQRAEWPWIGAMVAYTMTSLWLLAQPLVKGA